MRCLPIARVSLASGVALQHRRHCTAASLQLCPFHLSLSPYLTVLLASYLLASLASQQFACSTTSTVVAIRMLRLSTGHEKPACFLASCSVATTRSFRSTDARTLPWMPVMELHFLATRRVEGSHSLLENFRHFGNDLKHPEAQQPYIDILITAPLIVSDGSAALIAP